MYGWSAIFVVLAIIAGALGVSSASGIAVNIAWILFSLALFLCVVFLLLGRRS